MLLEAGLNLVKRGEIRTVSGGANYTGKPRPAVIVQEDRFNQTASITLCVLRFAPRPSGRRYQQFPAILNIAEANTPKDTPQKTRSFGN